MPSNIVSRPPKFGDISNWLGTDTAVRILSFARNSSDQFVPSDIGYGENKRVDLARRRSSKLKQLGEVESELKERLQKALPLIFDRLGCTPFEPASLEFEMVAHSDGAHFSRHADTIIRPEMTSYRAISAVYYFHGRPKSFHGGFLRIHSIGGNPMVHSSISNPRTTSSFSFHLGIRTKLRRSSVHPVRFEDSRFAINCWVYAKQLPSNFYQDTGYVS